MAESRRVIYTAEAHVTGGRADGHGRTSDGGLEVELHRPKEMGGPGGGTNPEQLFAVGYAACFESALEAVRRRRRQVLGEVTIYARVMLMATDERAYKIAVELAVMLPSLTDRNEAEALVRAAHEVCPYSNATRANIDVTLIVNGRAIDAATAAAA